MSIQTIVRPLVALATLTLAGSSLAGPPSHPLPKPKQAVTVAHYCEPGVPAPGYRDVRVRFGTYSQSITRPVPAR
jgi:hypothetical protein